MKKERKIEYEKSVGSKISDSLFAVREVIKEADVQEIYDADNYLEIEARTTELGKFAIYPAILNDKDSLIEFWKKINNVRFEHELYLSYTSSAYLLYMSKYLTKLIQFLGIFNKISYPLVGTILIFNIQSWQRSFDKHLVKEINNNQLKLTSKTGKKWENEKEKNDK